MVPLYNNNQISYRYEKDYWQKWIKLFHYALFSTTAAKYWANLRLSEIIRRHFKGVRTIIAHMNLVHYLFRPLSQWSMWLIYFLSSASYPGGLQSVHEISLIFHCAHWGLVVFGLHLTLLFLSQPPNKSLLRQQHLQYITDLILIKF